LTRVNKLLAAMAAAQEDIQGAEARSGG
jgi:hypothetical protein